MVQYDGPGKVQIQAYDGSWEVIGSVENIGHLTDAVEDESQEWKGAVAWADMKNLTTSIQVKTTSTDLYNLIYGSNAYGIQSYVEGIAKEAAVPHYALLQDGYAHKLVDSAAPPLLPETLDDIPGDFPTVHIAGAPSPSEQKLIDGIGDCEGFELMEAKISSKLNAFAPPKVIVAPKLDVTSMMKTIEAAHAQFQGFAKQLHGAAQEMAPTLAGETTNKGRADKLRDRIPGINDWVNLPCTDCGNAGGRLMVWYAIQHLNDNHNPASSYDSTDPWSRERIADWLETLDADLRVGDAPVKEAVEPSDYTVSHMPGMDIDGTLTVGDWVEDKASGEVGQILAAKKSYSLDLNQNVIELKVCYSDGGFVFQPPEDVEKMIAFPGAAPGGYSIGDSVENVHTGELGTVVGTFPGYNGTDCYRVQWDSYNDDITMISYDDLKQAGPPEIDTDKLYPAKWTDDQLAALKKALSEPMHPGTVHHQLGTHMPPVGPNDVVSYWNTPGVEGRVVQYTYNANDSTMTFKVAWPDGTKSLHPREDLVLVEAYSPPEPDLGSWNSNKITYNNISPA